MFVALAPFLAVFALQANPPATPRLPPAMAALVDRARSVPPEFAADTLLRLAESDKVADPAWKRALIEEAFRQAAGAQQAMKRRGIEPGKADTRPYFLARAFAQNFDQLSLQCRAVQAMLKVDKRKARDLFDQVPRPQVPRVECEDPLVYDVSAYYETLAQVASSAFTPKEQAEDEPVKLAAGLVAAITSPVQVGPVAKALASLRVTPGQFQVLAAAFSAALKNLSGDDRSFSFSISRYATALADVEQLAAACRRQQVSTYPLIEAFRDYLVRQLSGSRCQDTGGFTISVGAVAFGQSGSQSEAPPDPVAFFNDKLRPEAYPAGTAIRPLESEEVRASKLEGSVATPPAWNNAEASELVAKYRQLLFGPDGGARSNEQKDTTEWKSQLQDYLSALADWQPGDAASGADYFYEKCYLLSSLINVVANGEARNTVLRSFLSFLEQSSFRQESRMEWFLPVNSLLARAATDPALAEIAREMRDSGDAVIALYAQLEGLLPRPPAKTMGLF